MNISNSVRKVMIQHLSIAVYEARSSAEMFATFEGDNSSTILEIQNEIEQLEQGIKALISEEVAA